MDIEAPAPELLIPRDGRGKPLVVPKGGGKPVALTRTTTFIDAIDDKSNLMDWKQRGVLIGAARKLDLLDEVRAIDPYGTRAKDKTDRRFKEQIAELCEKAMDAAGFNDKREDGTRLHGYSELADAGLDLPDSASIDDVIDIAEYRAKTQGFTWRNVEQFTVCPELGTAGTPDRIGHCPIKPPKGRLKDNVIGDLKTGTVDYGGLKMAMQLAIYAHSEFYDPTVFPAPARYASAEDAEAKKDSKEWKEWRATEFDAELAATAYTPIPDIDQKWGVIINLPAGSGEAELFWADLVIGWKAAKLATIIRATRALGSKALVQFAA